MMRERYISTQIFLFIGILLMSLTMQAQTFQPIQLNITPNTGSCNSNGGNFQVSVPGETLTGDLIPVEITLPGTLSEACDINFTIDYSSPNGKLSYVTSGSVPLTQSGNTLTTINSLPGNDGQNFIVWFRFANHYTCNGEIGTINISFDACGTRCDTSVQVIARADNYWTIKKTFIIGNLTCGISTWRIWTKNSNPNPSSYGDYALSGTITETASVPVSSNGVISVNNYTGNNFIRNTYLQNCQNEGTVITNTANYNFTLGDGCTTMQGTISADSPVLSSPNANISFTKRIFSTSGYATGYPNSNIYSTSYEITPGCTGFYVVDIHNNGNVPWTNISIQDNLNIPGLNITSIYFPIGWTSVPALPAPLNQNFTFSASPNFVLQPGSSTSLTFYFTVDSTVPIGTNIPNTASVSYNAYNQGSSTTGSSGSNACQGVNCPTINTSIHDTIATANIHTIPPASKVRIKKCILNNPVGGLYQIGDTIHFRTIIYNSGSGSLTTSLTDGLNTSGQNLNLIGTPNYTYYENEYIGYQNNCGSGLSNQQPISFGLTNNSTLQNLDIDINGMPGICDMSRANYLVVDFDVVVMPQIYGSKTNTAYVNSMGSSANYSVDQSGVLEVNKYADQEFVENGGNFNYIIKVTNSGTVPMDHISISDQMPSCVLVEQGITVKDFAGNALTFNQSGNLTININPSVQLMPGQYLTITIPATKQGGSQCCNEQVTAKGTMITSSTLLEANFGSASEPAACVKSTECCDIPDFEAHLYENSNGTYQVAINGGAVPIQEVNISVIDYHVEYSQRECKPQDMGAFGTLLTQTQVLSGLLLDTNSNNTSSLSWTPGNPSVMNTSVDFDITKPNILNLDCCDVDFYFCIKVSIKDVNCNVCEKVICIEKKPNPCDISVKTLKNIYCTGDNLDVFWANTSQSLVNVYLIPTNAGSSITIATNQPANGNIVYAIPSTIDCNKKYKIVVQSVDNEECKDTSNIFKINCCETTACDCLGWKSNSILYKRKYVISVPSVSTSVSSRKKYDSAQTLNTVCGGNITLKTNQLFTFTSPQFNCTGYTNPSCQPEYKWIITNNASGVSSVTIGRTIDLSFNNPGTYTVEIAPECNGNNCDRCVFTIEVEGKIEVGNSSEKTNEQGSSKMGTISSQTQDWNSSRGNKTTK